MDLDIASPAVAQAAAMLAYTKPERRASFLEQIKGTLKWDSLQENEREILERAAGTYQEVEHEDTAGSRSM